MVRSYLQVIGPAVLAAVLLLCFANPAAAADARFFIDDLEVFPDVPAQFVSDRLVVPARFVAEEFGADVGWDGDSRQVEVQRSDGVLIRFTVDEPFIEVAGQVMELDVAPIIRADRSLVPVRYLAGGLGLNVDWDNPTRAVLITSVPDSDYGVTDIHWQGQAMEGWLDLVTNQHGPFEYEFVTLEHSGTVQLHVTLPAAEWLAASTAIHVGEAGLNRVRLDRDADPLTVIFELAGGGEGVAVSRRPLGPGVRVTFPYLATGAQWITRSDHVAVRLRTTVNRTPSSMALGDPERVVVDLAQLALAADVATEMAVGIAGIEGVRLGQPAAGMVRMVIDLDEMRPFEVVPMPGTGVEVRFPMQQAIDTAPPPGGEPSAWRVFIDPGHGGQDPGAISATGLMEKEVNLAVSLRLRDLLEAEGVTVAMSRVDDRTVDLDDRPQLANDWGADLFVSIHFNSSTSSTPAGTETFYYENHIMSRMLAQTIQNRVVSVLRRPDRGVKRAAFRVLRRSQMPAALLEGLFLSNATDLSLIADEAVQEAIAQAVFDGIVDFITLRHSVADAS